MAATANSHQEKMWSSPIPLESSTYIVRRSLRKIEVFEAENIAAISMNMKLMFTSRCLEDLAFTLKGP